MTTEKTPEREEAEVKETAQETKADDQILRRQNAEFAQKRIDAKKERQESETVELLKKELEEIKSKMNERPEPQTIDQSYVQELEGIKIRTEVSDFVADNPQFAKYKSKIIELAKVSDLNYESLAYAAAGKDLTKLGAEKVKEADDEANETKMSGSTTPSSQMKKKEKSFEEMTDDEILSDIIS